MGAPKGNQYAVGRKDGGGKPSLCTPEVVETARDYIENYKDHDDIAPSLVGLAKVVDVRRETFYLWAKFEGDEKDPRHEFKDIMAALNEAQERTLINNGLSGVFTPTITKLMLAKHGYHDKQDATLSGPDGGAVKAQFNFIPVGPDDEAD